MKIYRKEKAKNGRQRVYLFGIKVLSYRGRDQKKEFERIYSKRFDGLSKKELTFVVKEQFKNCMGKELDLDNPKTFNEKLSWIKLYYQDPLMTICADKVKGRDYFLENIKDGQDHLVKQYGVYDSVDEIDFDAFPETFVLKSNWGSGAQIIVRDKSKIDVNQLKEKMKYWLDPKSNHYFYSFEYGYKNIVPKIICEEFLEFEYKIEFFCFNGKPEFFWVVFGDKTDEVKANFYTMDWKKLPVYHKYPNFDTVLEVPKDFNEMRDVAKILSGDFPFVRIDFYKTKKSWRFSEITFFHWGALMPFTPEEFDAEFGKLIALPKIKK